VFRPEFSIELVERHTTVTRCHTCESFFNRRDIVSQAFGVWMQLSPLIHDCFRREICLPFR
jgi:hypothetical protein